MIEFRFCQFLFYMFLYENKLLPVVYLVFPIVMLLFLNTKWEVKNKPILFSKSVIFYKIINNAINAIEYFLNWEEVSLRICT